jgi:hypothetical protein
MIKKYNASNGRRLLRVVSGEYRATNTLGTSCLFANPAGLLTTSYYTSLDGNRLQPEDLTVADALNYRYVQNKLKGTPVGILGEYVFTSCHIDDWSSVNTMPDAKEKDYDVCGLDLSVEKQYGKVITKTNVDTNCILVGVCQKELVSNPMGVACQ